VIHFCGLKLYQVSKCIERCQCSIGTVSCNNGLSVNSYRTRVKHGEGTGRQSTSFTDADTAHTVENLKKLNFEEFEHPLYSLDLTPSDSPV
jgi:hypothetical protein